MKGTWHHNGSLKRYHLEVSFTILVDSCVIMLILSLKEAADVSKILFIWVVFIACFFFLLDISIVSCGNELTFFGVSV